uniref:Thiosulfate sulfurtransferase n=1 Tax=Stegastes partitus TaxID=144197 RepID=A0A3B4ZT18_9TELE
MAAQTRALVSAQWLINAVRTNQVGPKLRVLDGSYYVPKLQRSAKAEFAQRHVPGASFFDIDECSDQSSGLDHMLPDCSSFSRYVGELGIGNDTHVVVYDCSEFGSFSAPRVWWMFRVFGHSSVSVLDGGMRGWTAAGGPLTAESCRPERTDFRATLDPAWVKSYEEVLENIRTRQVQMVDARVEGRYRGTEPEPRDGKQRFWALNSLVSVHSVARWKTKTVIIKHGSESRSMLWRQKGLMKQNKSNNCFMDLCSTFHSVIIYSSVDSFQQLIIIRTQTFTVCQMSNLRQLEASSSLGDTRNCSV